MSFAMIFFKSRPQQEPQGHPDDQRASSEAFAKVTGFFCVILAIVGSALVYFGVDNSPKMEIGLVAGGICLLCLVPVFAGLCLWFIFRALRARHIADYHAEARRQNHRPQSGMPVRATFQPEEGEPEMVNFSKF